MKTNKLTRNLGFVFLMLISLNAKAAPLAAWVDPSVSAPISVTTMNPDVSVSGGQIDAFETGDFNCDGYDDLVVFTGALKYGKIFIHLGGASYSFPSSVLDADYTVTGTVSKMYIGREIKAIADVDGDGCSELVALGSRTSAAGLNDTLFLFNSTTISGWATDAIADNAYTDLHADSSISMGVSSSNNYQSFHNVGNIDGEAKGEHLAVCSGYTYNCYLMPVSALLAGTGTVESNSDYYFASGNGYEDLVSGDFDGDGQTDLLIGSSSAGVDNVVVLFGPLSSNTETFNAAGFYETSWAGDDNIIIFNGNSGIIGDVVSKIDLENDGKDEIIFTYPDYNSDVGAAYVISGLDALKGVTNEVYTGNTVGAYNFGSGHFSVATYTGENSLEYFGISGNIPTGDFDGDGYEDYVLGAQNYSAGTAKGRAYIIFNRMTAGGNYGAPCSLEDFGSEIVLSDTNRAHAYFEGENNSDQFFHESRTGDFNNDGIDELVVLAPGANSLYGQLTVIGLSGDVDQDGILAATDCHDGDAAIGAATTWYADSDADGAGSFDSSIVACVAPVGFVATSGDCNDSDAGTVENTWYLDADADGFGGSEEFEIACAAPRDGAALWVNNNEDCNDADATLNPNTIWYADLDADGFAGDSESVTSCTTPAGPYAYYLTATDCNDADAAVSPDSIWYIDNDSDNFGDDLTAVTACVAPSPNYVSVGGDCHDANNLIHPNTLWYADTDADGFGNAALSLTSCANPEGYVLNADDFNDLSAAAYPGAYELCEDGVDNDGNGLTDYADAAVCTLADADFDGVAGVDGDCDDTNAAVYPGAPELGDALDNNCNGKTDELLGQVAITTTLPAMSYTGDTFDIGLELENGTGFEDLELEVLAVNQELVRRPVAFPGLPAGASFGSLFCNAEATNCSEMGRQTVAIATGDTQTVTIPVTVPSLSPGEHVVRIRVKSASTGETVGYLQNRVFSPARIVLGVTK